MDTHQNKAQPTYSKEQSRIMLVGISFIILYFGYLYNRLTKPDLSSTQIMMHLFLGVIAFISAIITLNFVNKDIFKDENDQTIHVLVTAAIFILWLFIFTTLKKMI